MLRSKGEEGWNEKSGNEPADLGKKKPPMEGLRNIAIHPGLQAAFAIPEGMGK
jgi:hypothetical protein